MRRRRHVAINALGFLLVVIVHITQDEVEAKLVPLGVRDRYKRGVRQSLLIAHTDVAGFRVSYWTTCKRILKTILRSVNAKGFDVASKYWTTERAFACISRHRRKLNDYERLAENSEAVPFIAMPYLMSKRLATR